MNDSLARAMLLWAGLMGSAAVATAGTAPAPGPKAEASVEKAKPESTGRGVGPARGHGIAAEEPANRGRGCVPPRPDGPGPRPPAPPSPDQVRRGHTTIDPVAHLTAVKGHAEFLPAAPATRPARTARVTVPSRSGAQPASLTVAAGEVLRFVTHSGTWTVDERSVPRSGPDGHLESLQLHKNWGDRREVDTLPFGRLLARVGRGPWVDAGSEKAVRFLDSGELMLRINDNDGSLADNAGDLEIDVEVLAPSNPAR